MEFFFTQHMQIFSYIIYILYIYIYLYKFHSQIHVIPLNKRLYGAHMIMEQRSQW